MIIKEWKSRKHFKATRDDISHFTYYSHRLVIFIFIPVLYVVKETARS